MKKITLLLFILPFLGISQEISYSEPSLFIEKAGSVQINLVESEKTIFKSGLGETVSFYPAEIIDLNQNQKKVSGIELESTFITKEYQNKQDQYTKETAWIGIDELPVLIQWFESYVIPNLSNPAGTKKTVKYIHSTKEIQFKFDVYNATQTFTIAVKNTNHKDKYFWTESRTKDIPSILKTLKYMQTRTLN
jgi:hypothetical protein